MDLEYKILHWLILGAIIVLFRVLHVNGLSIDIRVRRNGKVTNGAAGSKSDIGKPSD